MSSDIDTKTPLASITQKQSVFTTQTLTIFADRVQIEESSRSRVLRRFIYFGGVKEEADVKGCPSSTALTAGILFVGAAVLAHFTKDILDAWIPEQAFPVAVAVCGIAGFVSGILAFTAFRRKRYVLAWNQPGAQGQAMQPLLWLWSNMPSEDEVRAFLDRLGRAHRDWQDRIESLQAAMNAPSEAETLRRFAALRDDDILTDEEFLAVKERVLSGAPRRMGFDQR